MSAPRISRGPMAAEVLERDYTRVGNELLRDARISYKAKGIFCWLASHREGFGVSPESIAAAGADGISAVKSALRELELYGYLSRSQVRRADGLMGDFTYRITDMPSSAPVDGNHPPVPTSDDADNRRSEPVDGYPLADEPPADNRPHKKTIPLGKKISSEKTTSPSPPEPSAGMAPAEVPDGGGGGSDLRSIAVHITDHLDYLGQVPDKQQRERITAALVAVLKAGWTMDGLAVYLNPGNYRPDNPAAFYLAKLTTRLPATAPEPAPAPIAAAAGVHGPLPSAAEYGAATVASVLYGEAPALAPSETWPEAVQRAQARLGGGGSRGGGNGHVDGWMQLAGKGHQPYSNDVWSAPADPIEAAGVPHCGDWDCDPRTRLRDVDEGNGLKSSTLCPKCHPKMRW